MCALLCALGIKSARRLHRDESNVRHAVRGKLRPNFPARIDKQLVTHIPRHIKINSLRRNFKPNAILEHNSLFPPVEVAPRNLKIRAEKRMSGTVFPPRYLSLRDCQQIKRGLIRAQQTSKCTRIAAHEIHRQSDSHFGIAARPRHSTAPAQWPSQIQLSQNL